MERVESIIESFRLFMSDFHSRVEKVEIDLFEEGGFKISFKAEKEGYKLDASVTMR